MGRDPKERDYAKDAADALQGFGKIIDSLWADDLVLVSLSIRMPQREGGEFFMVVRASQDGKSVVAFRSADYMEDLMVGFARAAKSRSLRFKEDKYAENDG